MIKRLDHVAIAVKQIGPVLAQYRRLLGFTDAHIEDVPQQGVRAALLPVPGAEIELLEPIDPQGAVARFLERRGEGLHHICLEVDDIAAELERLKAAGLPLVDQQARPGLAGSVAFLHPRASHGVLVELAQKTGHEPAPGKPPPDILVLDHAAILVGHIEEAQETFQRTLGLVQSRPSRNTTSGIKLGFMALGNAEVEFLEAVAPKEDWARFVVERGEGLHHFALTIRKAQFSPRLAALRQAGGELLRVWPQEDPQFAFIDPRSIYGVLIELVKEGHP